MLGVLLFFLFLFLAVRAHDEYRWSDWGFGDAQTMLSLRQWEEGGWLHNYLLFKPQGYARVIDLLDEPELRHHAHGTCPGSSPRVGPRLLYTHYPAGYLVPYAVLFKLGIDSLFSVRLLSIVFSIGALVLMYLVFARITSPRVSFVAVLFYALTPSFLGYADSLANQPIDDLLRFGFMFAVAMATRSDSERRQRHWMILAWITEFCLSLTSFDSVFFIYAWLVGWDVIEKRGFRWKTYLLFALAPISAHGLQFLQNAWYLGWSDAYIDIKDAFLLKNGADQGYNTGQGRLSTIAISIVVLFESLFKPGPLLVLIAAVYVFYTTVLRGKDRELPTVKLLSVLFLCGLSFVLVLPHAARMPYEARQMLPFASLLVSGMTWSLFMTFRKSLSVEPPPSSAPVELPALWASMAYVFLTCGLLLVFWFAFVSANRWPVYDLGDRKAEMVFAQDLQKIRTRFEPVFFDVGGFMLYWDPTYVKGYPQILPLTEYYTGSRPVLCFNEAENAARDIATMARRSPYRFSPVLISSDPQVIERVFSFLEQQGMVKAAPRSINTSMERYVLDLTDYLKWGGNEADIDYRKL